MSHETRLLDLVVEWEERRAAGQDVSPEDLCRDCPELVEPLKARLRALAGLEAALDLGGPPLGETVACAQDCEPPPGGAGPVAENAWPVIANYEILEELGRGGMGVVYKARQITLGRIVALKTILPQATLAEDSQRRFLQEAKAMALLQHPNIVQIHRSASRASTRFWSWSMSKATTFRRFSTASPCRLRGRRTLVVLAGAVHAAHRARHRPPRSEA